MKRRNFLGSLAVIALLPARASAQVAPEQLAHFLAGAPCDPSPETLVDLRQLAALLGPGPIDPRRLKGPTNQSLVRKILKALYGQGSSLAWEAVPFAARPGRLAHNAGCWGKPPT